MEKNIKKYFPIFLLPTLASFVVVFLLPFVMGIYLSFTKFTTVENATWVGIDNYIKAFTQDENFLNALWFTIKFTVVSVITINIFAFLLALLLTRALKGTAFFRTVFFMPNLIGGIVLGYIWNLLINSILGIFGYDITYSADYGFWGLVFLLNWQLIGYMMVIYIASLQNIPSELNEAARIDGASPFSILRHITIPMVMPAVTICLFLTITNSFKLFDQNLALTGGAPARETSMLALDIFNTFYGRIGWQGVGQAKAVVFFIIVALIAFVQLKITGRKEVES
ncbi:MAG: sugar ABC transporter permease [Clostridia bacterium]|nr:sugar ABC transporter permease [Clostridia bacterium]